MISGAYNNVGTLIELRNILNHGLGGTKIHHFLSITANLPTELEQDEKSRIQILRFGLLRSLYKNELARKEYLDILCLIESLNTIDEFFFRCEAIKLNLLTNRASEAIEHLIRAETLSNQVEEKYKGYYESSLSVLFDLVWQEHSENRIVRLLDAMIPEENDPYYGLWNCSTKLINAGWQYLTRGNYREALDYTWLGLEDLRTGNVDSGIRWQLEANYFLLQALTGSVPPENQINSIQEHIIAIGNYRILSTIYLARGFIAEGLGDISRAKSYYLKSIDNFSDHQDFTRATKIAFDIILSFAERHLSAEESLIIYKRRWELEQAIRLQATTLLQPLIDQAQEIQLARHRIEKGNIELISTLAAVGEHRDELTGQHTKRVGQLSFKLASALNLPDADVIGDAAILHDIGKVALPDEILLKKGKFSADEFDIMKTHTTHGAKIFENSHTPVLRMAYHIAYSHHERWDGTGYPQRLKGEEIPISARIVAVADVFDALVSERPYKRAWTYIEALEEIKRQSGSHFDPQVVQALLALGICESGSEPDTFRFSEGDKGRII